MKSLYNITFLLFVIFSSLMQASWAQSLNLGINYQAVLRDAQGNILSNSSQPIRFALRQGNSAGTIIYEEEHSPSTNVHGLVNLIIGTGSPMIGNWQLMDWAQGPYFLQVFVSGTDMGVHRLESVPYAKYATDMQLSHLLDVSPSSPQTDMVLKWDGNQWAPAVDGGGISYQAGNGIAINGSTIENTAPDQTVSLTGSGATSISGTYPNFTISSADHVDDADADPSNELQFLTISGTTLSLSNGGGSVSVPAGSIYQGGTGIAINGAVIDNTAPDQIVSLNGAGATSISGSYPNFTISSTDQVDDADADPNNEIQSLSKTGSTVSLSNGGGSFTDEVNDADADPGNELQSLSITGNLLSLSDGGGTINLPAGPVYNAGVGINIIGTTISNTGDLDPLNELQSLTLSGNTLSLSNGGGSVSMPAGTVYQGGTGISINGSTITNTAPDQTVSLTGSGATSISGTYPNFTISSTDQINDADADPANELQNLSLSGSTLSLSNGGGSVNLPAGTAYQGGTGISINGSTINNTAPDQTVSLSGSGATTISGTYPNFTISSTDQINDADADPNNEFQALSKSGNTITLSNGGGSFTDEVDDADANPNNEIQSLSLSGSTLSLSNGGGSVNLPGGSTDTSHWELNSLDNLITDRHVGLQVDTAMTALHIAENESVLFGSDTIGEGSRFLWSGGKGALRAGLLFPVYGSYWNPDSVGNYSLAVGQNTKAKGSSSVALGTNTEARSHNSFAMGTHSIAIGSVSSAIGIFAIARGDYSTALGRLTTANGNSSMALGSTTTADGSYSTAMGHSTSALSFAETSMGNFATTYTPTANGKTSFQLTDRLLVVGNGLNSLNRSDALTIMKDGRTGIGESSPKTRLHVSENERVLFGADTTGAGKKMIWFGDKGALRAGSLHNQTATFWDADSVGLHSIAVGENNRALGNSSATFGAASRASGNYSFAAGVGADALGVTSVAMGSSTTASGYSSVAMGRHTEAPSQAETALGSYPTIYTPIWATQFHPNDRLFVLGNGTAPSNRSDALMIMKDGRMGIGESGPKTRLHVPEEETVLFGSDTTGGGNKLLWLGGKGALRAGELSNSQSSNWDWDSVGMASVAIGYNTKAKGTNSTAFGNSTTASGGNSIAFGQSTTASGSRSMAVGALTQAIGVNSLAAGFSSVASGSTSSAFGGNTVASGSFSTSFGQGTTASGDYSTAFGEATTAGGDYSFSAGNQTAASGDYSTALGDNSTASGFRCLATGFQTEATGENSTALGYYAFASGKFGIAIGTRISAPSLSETAMGIYHTTYTPANATGFDSNDRLFILGNGTSSSNRSDALTILKNGKTLIGNGTPGDRLQVEAASGENALRVRIAGTTRLRVLSNGGLSVGANSPSNTPAAGIYVSGEAQFNDHVYPRTDNSKELGRASNRWLQVYAVNGTIQTSDRRLKRDIQHLEYGLDQVLSMNPVRYRWKSNPAGPEKLGFIAQDLQQTVPEVVMQSEDPAVSLGVNYSELIPVLVKAIQELTEQVNDQQNQIHALQAALQTGR
ncbi:MAG: tail fiber domain-containing protein [Bacteroidota bacterium]